MFSFFITSSRKRNQFGYLLVYDNTTARTLSGRNRPE
jgi:hypothetical protein